MADWFEDGLRFSCTMCGNCCTGPEGYVLVSDEEVDRLAKRFRLTRRSFLAQYTRQTPAGRSLTEVRTGHGLDCVFLDRETKPGRAICGVYEDRPAQCRTWPFWGSNLTSERAWRMAGRTCPGMGKGRLHPPQKIRILRDEIDM